MTELEQQVQELQSQVQVCQPCPPPPVRCRERQFEEALQENAALRRLLKAMGIDEYCQQRYLESFAKRDAVESILKRHSRENDPVSLSHGNDAEPRNGISAHAVAAVGDTGSSPQVTTNLGLNYGEIDGLNVDSLQSDMNANLRGLHPILYEVLAFDHSLKKNG